MKIHHSAFSLLFIIAVSFSISAQASNEAALEMIENGKAAVQAGDLLKAETYFKNAIEEDCDLQIQGRARLLLGSLLAESGHSEECIVTLEELLTPETPSPLKARAYLILSGLYRSLSFLGMASEMTEKGLLITSDQDPFYDQLWDESELLGQLKRNKTDRDQETPADKASRRLKLKARLKTAAFQEQDPADRASAMHNLGVFYLKEDNFRKAMNCFGQTAQQDHDLQARVASTYQLGMMNHRVQNSDDAFALLTQILNTPDASSIIKTLSYKTLAESYGFMADERHEDFLRVAAFQHNDADLQFFAALNMGRIREDQGLPKEALAYYIKAKHSSDLAKMDQHRARAYLEMARLYLELEQTDQFAEARNQLHLIAQMPEFHKEANELLERIQEKATVSQRSLKRTITYVNLFANETLEEDMEIEPRQADDFIFKKPALPARFKKKD